MKLRTRLSLAFFLMSVLPLATITLYSYRSSEKALRQVAATEAATLAGEMSRRMAFMTEDLQERVYRAWLPRGEGRVQAGGVVGGQHAEALQKSVVSALGASAALLDRLEITMAPSPADASPGPPPPPHRGRRPDGPQGAPAPPPPPGAPRGSNRVIVDLSMPPDASGRPPAPPPMPLPPGLTREQAARLSALYIEQMRAGLAKEAQRAAAEIRRAAEEAQQKRAGNNPRGSSAAGPAEPARVEAPVRRGREFGFPVSEGGVVVGRVDARLNLDRSFHTIVAMTRRDQNEIPFAVDLERGIHTPNPKDVQLLKSLGLPDRAGDVTTTVRNDAGEYVLVMRRDAAGIVFGIARPIGKAVRELRDAALRNLAIGLSIVTLAFIGIVPLSRRMTRNLSVLADGVRRIARGDLAARVPVRSRDEIAELGQAVNQMAAGLQAHEKLVVQQERLKRELELCRQIQDEMLPRGGLRYALAEVKGVSIPAREVGGDFFNYFVLPDGQLALLVGDVSGKGVGAAILMANIQATLRARVPFDGDLAHLVTAIDADIEKSVPRGVYLTLFIAIYDASRQALRYVNAGHTPPLVVTPTGAISELPSTGLPVGLFAGHGYEERSVSLGAGAVLFFYTDGIVEVENGAGDMFGPDRLKAIVAAGYKQGIDALLGDVERAVREFRGSADQFDDATMMVLRLDRAVEGTPA